MAAALFSVAPVVAGNVVEKSASVPATKSEVFSGVSTNRTVLAEKQLAKGITKRVVRDEKGRIFCDMVREGVATVKPETTKRPFKAPDNASFFEDFESHVDQLDWLPEGWTEINTPENECTQEMASHNINNTWTAQDTGDGYWTAITSDGVKECWIHFTYGWSYVNADGETIEGAASPQDEWLISPAFDVQTGHDLFFLCEADCGSVYYYDWSSNKYDRSVVECDLEVLASTDNGQNWTSLWKLSSDVCADMTDGEMYDVMAELKYNTYKIDLTNYYGQNIKLAFRYTNTSNGGFAGNSMAVDAITVAAPAAEAYYAIPENMLLAGISKDLHVYTESYALMPAYTDVTWTAASNAYTESNSWTFYDANGQVAEEITGSTAVRSNPYSAGEAIAWPMLTASNSNSSDTYTFDEADEEKGGVFYGGRVPDIQENEEVYVGNYDYQHKRMIVPYLSYGDYVYGTHSDGVWGDNIKEIACGNLFYAPAAPLTVTEVVLTLGEFDADDDAEFKMEIFTVEAYGQVASEPAATSVIHGSDITGFGFYNAVFPLATPYIIDSNVLIMVSGYDSPKVRTFAACAQSVGNDANHNYAYMLFDINGTKSLYSAADALTDYSSALIMSLNATYHFLNTDDEIVDLDPDTNEYEMAFEASNAPENWWIADGENHLPIVAEGTSYDWLTITPLTKEDGNFALRFSAENAVSARAKTVILSNGGNEVRVRIRQDKSSGISSIETADKYVTVVGDVLSVIGESNDVRIEVYSIAGMKLASGSNGIDISGLPKGIFLVRAAGKTYRFVR